MNRYYENLGLEDAEERYRNDVEFKVLVDMFTALISKGQFTPSEIRQAAILGCTHFEMWHTKSTTFYVGDGTP